MSDATLRRLITGLAAALVIWGGLALTRHLREDKAGTFTLTRVDTGAVDSVVLARGADSVLLSRGDKGAWRANGFAADSANVRDLLRALVDTATRGELVSESKSSHASFAVDADSGRRFVVRGHGKSLMDLTVGRRTSDWGGVYVRRSAEDPVYSLRGDGIAESLTRAADDWRDHGIVRVVPESVTVVELRRGSRSTTLSRKGKAWTVSGGAGDSTAVRNLLDAWRDVSAAGFATKAQGDSAHFSKPWATAVLRNGSAVLASLAFDSTAAGIWVRASGSDVVYRIDPWQLARLVPADSTLRAKAAKAAKPAKR